MKKLYIIFLAALVACTGGVNKDRQKLAEELVQSNILVDGHIDVPYRLSKGKVDVGVATEDGDFDFPRASSGGLNAPFMSIYIPAEKEVEGTAKEYADGLIDSVEQMVAAHPQKFAIAKNLENLKEQISQGKISMPLGMENGAAIDGNLENLKHFYDRGVRYITLTHSKSNHISDSSYDKERPWGGLSDFGEKLIREMNTLGVMVDVSHISDEAFWQVIEVSAVPVIASHSSARHFTPDFERNMSDEMIKALANRGGVIMINFGSTFISAKSRDSSALINASVDQFMQERNFTEKNEEVKAYMEALRKEKFVYADLEDVLDHFDHIRSLVGVDHIGIGSDFDGVGDSLPNGLKDVSAYPNLVFGLLERGYSRDDIKKILGENVLRVWRINEEYAILQRR
ncbi:dipeptidase [Microbulbifer epialgicus]|uniref:Dipeptidase n=1 Tax=Microbulbifer epialgicus TaxID=393907 RepID=A0ABV4NU45_9GAMM